MRLTLADLKKTFLRRAGQTYLVPHLLRRGEGDRALAALIALYEGWLGHERGAIAEDRAAEIIGDYRLARGLVHCLGEWYEWQSPPWPGSASPPLAAALAARGITSSSGLRLALYDHVNATAGGYLSALTREAALNTFAAELGVPRPILDVLLVLDTARLASLRRVAPAPPTPRALAVRYNQRVVETLLGNASTVEWVVAPQPAASAERAGTIVKRICFLARRMGVQYEVTLEDAGDAARVRGDDTGHGATRVADPPAGYAAESAADTSLDDAARPVRVTLFGPQELTGAANQYGERLARLCRALLGYRRHATTPDAGARPAALEGSDVYGTARVYLHGRPVQFALDERLLWLLGPAYADGEEEAADVRTRVTGAATPTFDSSVEARLYRDFSVLARTAETRGWRIEREPEPVLAADVILIPDFALSRGARRVYLEIAGYWRPDYRERKARKLAALHGRVALIVAAPTATRADFAMLGDGVPILWYTDGVRVPALLDLLEHAYGDQTARLDALDTVRIRAEVRARGHVPPEESWALLRAYSRGEAAAALARVVAGMAAATPAWVEGVGICDPEWLASLVARVQIAVGTAVGGAMTLARLRAWLVAEVPELGDVSDAAAETLAMRAGLVVTRTSLFTAEVRATPSPVATPGAPAPATMGRIARPAQPRGGARRKHHRASYSTPPLFMPEQTGDRSAGPQASTGARDH